MTSSTDKNCFSLTAEARQALRDFPGLRGRIFFAAAADNRGLNDPEDITLIASRKTRQRLTETKRWPAIAGMIERTNKKKSSRAERFDGGPRAIYGLVMHDHSTFMKSFGRENLTAARQWVFDHELGHLIVDGGMSDDSELPLKDYPLAENAADAYATLRHFQRYGQDSTALPLAAAWRRAARTLRSGNAGHFSTPVIDRIVADSAHNDFSKLSPQETRQLAARYARACTPEPDQLKAAQRHYAPLRRVLKKPGFKNDYVLKKLAETTLSAPDAFTFQIGLSVFSPFLHPQGATVNGRDLSLPAGKCQKLQAAFAARMHKLGIADTSANTQALKPANTRPCLKI